MVTTLNGGASGVRLKWGKVYRVSQWCNICEKMSLLHTVIHLRVAMTRAHHRRGDFMSDQIHTVPIRI